MKMKMLVFLVILALAACLPAEILTTDPDIVPELNPYINVNEASNMVFTSADPNYVGNSNDPNYVNGFICDNNTYPRAYWKVGNNAVMNCANDPIKTPVLRGDGSLVLVFVLPVKPTGQVVTEAQLVSYVGYISGIESVDLYGLRHVDACDVNNTEPNKIVRQSDYFVGSFGCDPNATPIQTNYIEMPYSASINKWHITGYHPPGDMNGPDRLRCWLQKQYNEGAVGGDYVLLRLNVGGYRPIGPYHQIQVSTMWDNRTFKADANDVNDMNSIPIDRLEKTFSHSPRLVLRFDTSAPACPGPGVYCCAALPGDITGNCHVDTNDLKIIADSWLDTIAVSEANLLSRYSFERTWDNSVAGGYKAIPFDSCEPNTGGSLITDAEKGRVADIHSSTSWLYVGPDPLLDTNNITTQLTVATWLFSTNTSSHRIAGKGYSWYLNVDQGLHFFVRDANDPDANHPPITLDGNKIVSDSKWHHVAATYDTNTGALKLYVDGVPDNSLIHYHVPTSTIYQFGATGSPYAIGARIKTDDANDANIPSRITALAGELHGYVDEVRVYGRVLSAEEIAGLASWGMPADVTGDNTVNLSDFAALAEDWLECALFPNPGTECLK